MTVIIAKTERLSETNSSNINEAKLLDIRSLPLVPRQNHYYQRSSKSLYSYNYNTDIGIQVQEYGHLNNVGTKQEALEVRGSYNYTDNDGNTFQISYIANENGFQPKGTHLPTVPPLIKKALQYSAEENGKE